jgi:hypothetical protein
MYHQNWTVDLGKASLDIPFLEFGRQPDVTPGPKDLFRIIPMIARKLLNETVLGLKKSAL